LADPGRVLGRAIGRFINILSAEVVAVGGGLTLSGDLLFLPPRALLSEIAFETSLQCCGVVPAALGTDAGLVGATVLALRRFG